MESIIISKDLTDMTVFTLISFIIANLNLNASGKGDKNLFHLSVFLSNLMKRKDEFL